MSERLIDNGCGEGFAGWRGPFCVSSIEGSGLSGDDRYSDSGVAIHCLSLRPLVRSFGKIDGSESAGEIMAHTHPEPQSSKSCGLNACGLKVAINRCDNEFERFSLGANAVT